MYMFYLDSVLLPVAPDKLTISIKNQNTTINLINDGEVNILKDAGLTDIEFEALVPSVEYGFSKYANGFVSPGTFLDSFEKLKTDKKPFTFKVVRSFPDGTLIFDTVISVSLESYTITESVNDGNDVKVSFKLRQYKPYGTKTVNVATNASTSSTKKTTVKKKRTTKKSASKDKTYTVKSGDCLWNIAKKHYGDGSKYTKIYTANKDKIDKRNKGYNVSKYTIYPGQVLTIPAE